MGKKIVLLITLVVVLLTVAGCRPSITEMAVPDGWLLRLIWPTAAAAPAAEGWGWMREALAAKAIPILVGLLILFVVVSIFLAFDAWLRGGKASAGS